MDFDPDTEVHSYFKLDRFCNMYRTSDWKYQLGEIEKPLKEIAQEEAVSTFGIVIESDDQNEEDIKSTFDSIIETDYAKNKISVVLSAKIKSMHTQIFLNEVERLRAKGPECQLVFHVENDQWVRDRDAFANLMTGKYNFIIKIKAGQKVDSEFFRFVDKEVNEILDMAAFFEDCDNGIIAIPFGVVNAAYLDFQDYDLMMKELKTISIDQRSYREYEKKK